MKEMSRMILVLTVIAILSGLVLAFTFNMTNDKIIHNAEVKKQNAIAEVLPGIESYELKQKGDFSYYQGIDANGNPIGIAVEAKGGGFQGEIKMMVGFIPTEKKISAIKILSHLETPGLGARITETGFKSNYENKPFGNYSVVKRPVANEMEVEAISGATISSDAVTTIIQNTLKAVEEAFGGEL
ncbi:MAG: RnfABCDGE type electron transport complex subunit G [Halanaerobiales bacterium]|nr:RnfABCDGE type electron transport complex subunit G [Halanaerobiales bacterium]